MIFTLSRRLFWETISEKRRTRLRLASESDLFSGVISVISGGLSSLGFT